ncbi:MAG: 4Fe-4S binding protein, partial [Bacteroidota bacterium]|nr:4Fe-4S binding protein [Bacteroidota bacterium]
RNLIRLPSLQLTSSPERCIHCHTCITHCPMSLPVEQMVRKNNLEHTECILCGTCVDGCKSKAIDFEFKIHNNRLKQNGLRTGGIDIKCDGTV